MKRQTLSLTMAFSVLCMIVLLPQPSISQGGTQQQSETTTAGAKAPPVVKLTGQYAEQITVALLSLLSYSYYLTGEFDFSRQYAEQSIAQYKSLKNPLKGERLEEQVDRAYNILSWTKQWEKEPIVCTPRELRVVVRQGGPALRRLAVHSQGNIPLIVNCDSEKIKAHAEDIGNQREYDFEKEVAIEIRPEALNKSFDAMLIISSPKFPNFSARVPIHVEVQSSVNLEKAREQ